jgi:hypothetical protein
MNWVTGDLNKQCVLNTMYRAGGSHNTGKREHFNRCQLGYSDQSGTKDDPCESYCCENITNPPPQNVYITTPAQEVGLMTSRFEGRC